MAVNGRWAWLRPFASFSNERGTNEPATERAVGIRRRIYQPQTGLHPGLAAIDPLVIEWAHAGRMQRIELHAWKPDDGPYPGLPTDDAEALARRSERIQVSTRDGEPTASGFWPEVRPFTIDLRIHRGA